MIPIKTTLAYSMINKCLEVTNDYEKTTYRRI